MKRPYTPAELIAKVRAVLNPTADVVLAYRPKPKSKPARKRARRRKQAQSKSSI